MSDVKKIELALSDLTTSLVEFLNNLAHGCARQAIRLEKLERAAVEEKRLADYLHSAHRRIADLEERLAPVEEKIEDLDALKFILDVQESRISTLEDEMSGVLTSDDVREILEASELKITIS